MEQGKKKIQAAQCVGEPIDFALMPPIHDTRMIGLVRLLTADKLAMNNTHLCA